MVLMYDTSTYCAMFHSNSCNSFQLTERTRNSIANDQREINPKICVAEFWFLHMTHSLIVLYYCMKFHSKSLNPFQLTNGHQITITNVPREII